MGLVKDGIYKRVEYAIENVWDICSIINTDLGEGIPHEEINIPNNLIRVGIIDQTVGAKLKVMKGFRNRYGDIDDRIAFKTLKNHLRDFKDFIDQIEDFLKKG
ncbi:MAG: hypothetical protein A4E27_00787 [Methanobacterium sp. PtaU1.Bin242]|nr:MAG: hypothetical protein A4E27_00787 [Methanobacterium sp. PtaU1.Bin242]